MVSSYSSRKYARMPSAALHLLHLSVWCLISPQLGSSAKLFSVPVSNLGPESGPDCPTDVLVQVTRQGLPNMAEPPDGHLSWLTLTSSLGIQIGCSGQLCPGTRGPGNMFTAMACVTQRTQKTRNSMPSSMGDCYCGLSWPSTPQALKGASVLGDGTRVLWETC